MQYVYVDQLGSILFLENEPEKEIISCLKCEINNLFAVLVWLTAKKKEVSRIMMSTRLNEKKHCFFVLFLSYQTLPKTGVS